MLTRKKLKPNTLFLLFMKCDDSSFQFLFLNNGLLNLFFHETITIVSYKCLYYSRRFMNDNRTISLSQIIQIKKTLIWNSYNSMIKQII